MLVILLGNSFLFCVKKHFLFGGMDCAFSGVTVMYLLVIIMTGSSSVDIIVVLGKVWPPTRTFTKRALILILYVLSNVE